MHTNLWEEAGKRLLLRFLRRRSYGGQARYGGQETEDGRQRTDGRGRDS